MIVAAGDDDDDEDDYYLNVSAVVVAVDDDDDYCAVEKRLPMEMQPSDESCLLFAVNSNDVMT
jgi:hypothetical protein